MSEKLKSNILGNVHVLGKTNTWNEKCRWMFYRETHEFFFCKSLKTLFPVPTPQLNYTRKAQPITIDRSDWNSNDCSLEAHKKKSREIVIVPLSVPIYIRDLVIVAITWLCERNYPSQNLQDFWHIRWRRTSLWCGIIGWANYISFRRTGYVTL